MQLPDLVPSLFFFFFSLSLSLLNLNHKIISLKQNKLHMDRSVDFMDTINNNNRFHDYMEALQQEKKKIQVFQRELPLCLDLVNQAIENCKRNMYFGSECEEEEQTSNEEPVLEEFIPIKHNSSSSSEMEEQRVSQKVDEKVDWLRSVQLWNQNPDPPLKQVIETKDFLKEKSETTTMKSVQSSPPALPTTAVVAKTTTSSTGDNGSRRRLEEREREISNSRKARRCWSPELHRRFLQALQQLGGSHAATPKQIRELMKVDGLTNDEVKSHLQKYRLHTRRPSPITAHNNGNTQPTQFVVVGGLWVPPQEYTHGESTTTNTTTTTNTPPRGIYVPVATRPQLAMTSPTTYSLHSQETNSKGNHSIVVGDVANRNCSSSPASSSSTRTTTASPIF
ncbi:hypothetical protein GIB67_016698 [Kingdonia uniflora]|uniref:HTH myb-type domain-containing protein n=1 Tax=Kingdonia uniflora TaxID=39325 RepID=A0A7J7LMB3_9MAGN|nr:hypothetical protein GIB67_016698 [Kingdonia uniflora]